MRINSSKGQNGGDHEVRSGGAEDMAFSEVYQGLTKPG